MCSVPRLVKLMKTEIAKIHLGCDTRPHVRKSSCACHISNPLSESSAASTLQEAWLTMYCMAIWHLALAAVFCSNCICMELVPFIESWVFLRTARLMASCCFLASFLLQVRGLLTDEELYTAGSQPRYLSGVHVLVATPDRALAAHKMSGMPLCFADLRAVIVDEVDAILAANPASYVEVMEAACARARPPQEDAPEGSGGLALPGAGQGLGVVSGVDAVGQIKALKELAEQRQQQGGDAGTSGVSGEEEQQQEEEGGVSRVVEAEGSSATSAGAGEPGTSGQEQQQELGAGPSQQIQQQQGSLDSLGGLAGMLPATGMLPQPSPEQKPDAKPQVVLVGATVTDAEVDGAVDAGWLEEPVMVQVRG